MRRKSTLSECCLPNRGRAIISTTVSSLKTLRSSSDAMKAKAGFKIGTVSSAAKPANRSSAARPQTPEQRVLDLQLHLPSPPTPVGVYKPVLVQGNLAYASGHGPLRSDGTF